MLLEIKSTPNEFDAVNWDNVYSTFRHLFKYVFCLFYVTSELSKASLGSNAVSKALKIIVENLFCSFCIFYDFLRLSLAQRPITVLDLC